MLWRPHAASRHASAASRGKAPACSLFAFSFPHSSAHGGQQTESESSPFFSACLTLPLLLFSSAHRFWVVPTEPAHPVGLVAVFPALLGASAILIREAYRRSFYTGLKLASFLPAALLVGFLLHRALSSGGEALSIAVPFSGSRLMLSIGEVHNMDIGIWRHTFGALPLVAAGGVVGAWLYQIRRGAASFPLETLLFGNRLDRFMGFFDADFAALLCHACARGCRMERNSAYLGWKCVGKSVSSKSVCR